MSTSRGRHAGLLMCALLLSALMLPISAPAANFNQAVERYESGDYGRAAELLEQAVSTAPSSRAYHWLGKSYGHLAEQAGLFRALELARKTRRALEKAVELDPHNRAAVEDLMEFYQQAPALVGGSHERAAALRQQLAVMDGNTRLDNGS